MPKVSVIVCVYNRPRQVLVCLESLLGLDFEGFEVVVVDDASTDATPERLERFRAEHPRLELRIVRNPRNLGVSGARNAGLEAARGELAAFIDSDCTVEPGWLRALAAAFDAPEVAAASGTVVDAPARTWAERAYAGTCRIGVGAAQARPLVGNNMAFRAELARRYGFEPTLTYGCDEDELAWRLASDGYRVAFAPGAVVVHDHPLTLGAYLRLARRQGVGSARYGYKRGFYVGRDLLFLFAAFLSLPLGALDPRLLWVPLAFFLLQLAAMLFNEVAFKGKPLPVAVAVLPLCLLYNLVKAWSVAATLARIALGREDEVRRSKRRWQRWRTAREAES